MTHPAATPQTAEQIEAIILKHCYPFSDVGIGGTPQAATAIIAALAPAERTCPDCSELVGHTSPCIVPYPAPAERAEVVPDGVEIRGLKWLDRGSDGATAFIADTTIGRFVYGTDIRGQSYYQDPHREEDHPSEAAAKESAEAAWRAFVLEKIRSYGVTFSAPTRAGALDAAGMIEKTRDRLVEAVEAWGDGLDAGRVYNARQSVVMKALNAYLDAKAALAAGDSSSARLNAYDNERPRNAKRALTADDK